MRATNAWTSPQRLVVFGCSLLIALGIAAPVSAETETQDTSVARNLGLYGGELTDMEVSPISGTVFAVTLSPSGVFRSTDAGETWEGLSTEMNPGTGAAVTVDTDTGDVYVLAGDDLLKSTDDGETWENIADRLGERSTGNVLAYGNGRLMVAIDNGQVGVSSDEGASFTIATIDSAYELGSLAASSSDDVMVAVLAGNEDTDELLYRSMDGGASWTDMAPHDSGMAEGNRFSYATINPDDSNHIVLTSIISGDYPGYQTTDGGTSWNDLSNDGDSVDGGCLMFDADGRLYVGFSYTDNAGAETPTWESIAVETPLGQIYGDVCAADPADSATVYYNTTLGPAKSNDGGASWTDQVTGMSAFRVYDISQTTDKDFVWIGANGGLAKTENFTDDDPTWEYPVDANNGSTIRSVLVDPSDPNYVVAGSSVIQYSENGGDSWTSAVVPESFSEGTVWDIAPSRVTDVTLYAIWSNLDLNAEDTGDVLMSEDSGQTWTSLGFTDSLPPSELTVASDDTLYVGTGGDVEEPRVYTYNGSSWSQLSQDFDDLPITSVVLDPNDDNRLFVTSDKTETAGGLYVSEDAGSTWTQITEGLDDVMRLATFTAQGGTSETFYMVGQDSSSLNGVIYKSTDNGVTWDLYYTGLKQEQFYALFYDGLMLGNDRGLYDIKSRAKLALVKKVKAKKRRVVTVSLKDAATGKKLKNQTVRIQKKVSGDWKKFKTVKTNAKGKARFMVSKSLKRVRLRWVPKNAKEEEYVTATKTLRLKKS